MKAYYDFLLPRPRTDVTPQEYAQLTLSPGAEISAIGVYAWYHVSALQKASLRNDSLNDLCTSCHADKRGPWIHEHPPVEESCAICHTPHGSSHRALLAQKPPVLCGDCHANGHTHGIYDGRGTLPNTLPSNVRFVSGGCTECHRQIHGSNAPSSSFGQYFLR